MLTFKADYTLQHICDLNYMVSWQINALFVQVIKPVIGWTLDRWLDG